MNATQYPIRQNRFAAAALASFASTLVLSCVVWLFSAVPSPATTGSDVAVHAQPTARTTRPPSSGKAGTRLTAARIRSRAPTMSSTSATGPRTGVIAKSAYAAADTIAPTRWAREQGAMRTAKGWGMLVEQAAESFHLWRGLRPDTRPVLEALQAT